MRKNKDLLTDAIIAYKQEKAHTEIWRKYAFKIANRYPGYFLFGVVVGATGLLLISSLI